jgi:hypothetical protein
MSSLLPCPFCAGPAKSERTVDQYDNNYVRTGCPAGNIFISTMVHEHVTPLTVAREYGHKGPFHTISAANQKRYTDNAATRNNGYDKLGYLIVERIWNNRPQK